MKYVNCLTKPALLSAALILFGCATGGGTKNALVIGADKRPDMVSTLEFIPEQKVGPEGERLAYEARVNPYLSQRGRVKRESVVSFIEGRRSFKAGYYDQAEQVFTALTTEDRSLSGPWVMLGDIARERKDYPQAVELYVKAIEVNRLNVNAYLRLAKAQRLQGQFLHAQNTYANVLEIWPDFPEAHLNLAVLYDVYLNHPLRAQRHMEAYHFLSGAQSGEVAGWLAEIQQRTGIAPAFSFEQPGAASEPLSYSN